MLVVKKDKITGDALGTGRRKSSVARVRIRAGSGNITINKRSLEGFFVLLQDRRSLTDVLDEVGHRSPPTGRTRGRGGDAREADRVGRIEHAGVQSPVDDEPGDNDKKKIGARPGEGHPSRPIRVLRRPRGIVRRTRESQGPAGDEHADDRQSHHADRFPLDMWNRIERDLATLVRGGVTPLECRPCVSGAGSLL